MLINTQEYLEIVSVIKEQIKTAQQRTVLNANRELILLYWNTGKVINEYKKWGNNFIETLARDIKSDFPEMRGFSERNLKYMAKFHTVFNDLEFVQQAVAQLPWRHSIYLIERVNDKLERNWYVQRTIENGWSSNILAMQIDSGLYERQAVADKTTNFQERLRPLLSFASCPQGYSGKCVPGCFRVLGSLWIGGVFLFCGWRRLRFSWGLWPSVFVERKRLFVVMINHDSIRVPLDFLCGALYIQAYEKGCD